MPIYYCFQLALSDKSTCGGCNEKIAEDILRVKRHDALKTHWSTQYKWHHFDEECFWSTDGDAREDDVEALIHVRFAAKEDGLLKFDNHHYIPLKRLINRSWLGFLLVGMGEEELKKIHAKLNEAKGLNSQMFADEQKILDELFDSKDQTLNDEANAAENSEPNNKA